MEWCDGCRGSGQTQSRDVLQQDFQTPGTFLSYPFSNPPTAYNWPREALTPRATVNFNISMSTRFTGLILQRFQLVEQVIR